MVKINLSFIFLLLFACCNRQQTKLTVAKGELAFLLHYNNRLPSDVGFLTNHIMERRMANLMKENYEPFMRELGSERPLIIDTVKQVIFAQYGNNQTITVDVINDALWIDCTFGDTVLHFADRTSLQRPE